ncbi:unnamed protein product [Heligmosomoides polygyrus]|uniref:GAT domain-containing protein n=1 Tax=Heligmosomoides polygyrus TaxID=6339 RepID=A0A183GFJ6_HELPZ|nr:unnamed protein product [Heligmosomoides polygyrus]
MYAVLHDVIDKFASARNGDEHNQAHLCLKEMVEQNDQLQQENSGKYQDAFYVPGDSVDELNTSPNVLGDSVDVPNTSGTVPGDAVDLPNTPATVHGEL